MNVFGFLKKGGGENRKTIFEVLPYLFTRLHA